MKKKILDILDYGLPSLGLQCMGAVYFGIIYGVFNKYWDTVAVSFAIFIFGCCPIFIYCYLRFRLWEKIFKKKNKNEPII